MMRIITSPGGLPISVIVPLSTRRMAFFEQFTQPLIEANNTAEIIIDVSNDTASAKRNRAFAVSTQPFVFTCDDDCLLPATHLKTLYTELTAHPEAGYVYTGFYRVPVWQVEKKGFFVQPPPQAVNLVQTIDFDAAKLRRENYISPMALIRRQCWTNYDEQFVMLDDYDFYLSLLAAGITGRAVHSSLFYAFFIDEGTTARAGSDGIRKALVQVRKKHKIT